MKHRPFTALRRRTSYRHVLFFFALLVGELVQLTRTPQLAQSQERTIAPTYTIFATRQGMVGGRTANGHIIRPYDRFVALPSTSVLCSRGGYEYQVRITYKGRSVVVPVWDVGPWNTGDDYWSPQRRYHDLPVGVPMAQAAYLEEYNQGRDELGRTILLPNGIDIADGTFWQDLGMQKSDWVQVSFLWLGEDPGPGQAVPVLPPPTQGQQPVPSSVAPLAPPPSAPLPAVAADQPDGLSGSPSDTPPLPADALAIDNRSGTGQFTASEVEWHTANCGVNGEHVWAHSTSDPTRSVHHAIWRPTLAPGPYDVQVYIPACGPLEPTRSARYRITHAGQVREVVIDQAAAAGTWVSLGVYEFDGGGAQLVELNNLTGEEGKAVHFDAIAWISAADSEPPSSRITQIIRQQDGYLVRWDGFDDKSGVASYDVQVRTLPRGGWRDWVRRSPANEAWFGPDEGKHFAFRVRARDHAGNEEPWPDEGEEVSTSGGKP